MDIDAIIDRLSRDDVRGILLDLVDYDSPVRTAIRSALARPDTTEDELREVLRLAAQHFGPAALRPRQHQSAMPPETTWESVSGPDRSFGFDGGLESMPPSGNEGPTFTVRSEVPEAGPQPAVDQPRYLNARSTESSVNVGDEFALMIWVGEDQVLTGGGSGSAPLKIGAATLSIDLFADDFELIEKKAQKLDVPATGDSNRVRFELRAIREGAGKIEIAAWNGSAQVGAMNLFVTVGAAAVTNGAAKAEMDMRNPETGEYTLLIRFEEGTRTYGFQLLSDDGTVWPPFRSDDLKATQIEVATGLVGALNFEARNLGQLVPKEQERKLIGLGTALFQQMIPDGLKTALWESRGAIRRLNILSPGDPMPWELMRVTNATRSEGFFLGEEALIMRWKFGKRAPRKVAQGSTVTVAGTNPAAAMQEAEDVAKKLGGGRRLGTLSELTDCLDAGGFGVLHFAAHNLNVPGNALSSYVNVGGRPFNFVDLQMIANDQYASAAPLVFMNACTSAGTALLMTELSGWAQEFLRCGAGAYVGSLWEVRDSTSREFAEAFYDKFSNGGSLGESMRVARQSLKPEDPTRYAYSLYGNPQGARQVG